MSAAIGVAWTVYAITIIGLTLFSIGFIKYYQSKRCKNIRSTVVSIASISIGLATVSLLPIDIFLVSSTVDNHTGLKKKWADEKTIYWMTFSVQAIYYVWYGLIVGFLFMIIPYTYFYYHKEEEGEEERRDQKKGAFKYTMCFISAIGILFFFGLFLKPNILPPHIDLDWYRYLLTESHGTKAIWFVIGCLLIPSLVLSIVYTAPGLSIIPFNLIKGKSKIDVEDEDLHHRLMMIREQKITIEHKYADSNKALSLHDNRTLKNLNDEERILQRKLEEVEQDKQQFLQRTLKMLRPFKILIGFLLLLFTTLMFISIFISLIDKITYSVCGRKCGYIISQATLVNPINFILTDLARLFPMDHVLMIGIIIYFLLATMIGMMNVGIRFLWTILYRIKRSATSSHGLLFCAVLLSVSILGLNYSMTSVIAPGYAHYGTQVYCNHTEGGRRDCTDNLDKIYPCDIYAPIEICTPTISSTLMDRITLNTPLFGNLFYYSQWLFSLSFLLGFLICLFKAPSDDNQDDDEEQQGLLDGHHHYHHQQNI